MAEVFISYQRKASADLAYIIKDRLEDEGISVFLDIAGLTAAGPFPPQLGKAICEAKVFVCLLGPDTLESAWVQKEIEQACNLGLTLIPVFQAGFRKPDDVQSQSVGNLLDGQGVEFPAGNIFLVPALDKLVHLVKGALPPPPPPPPPPKKCWPKIVVAGVIGLVAGVALGWLFLGGVGEENEVEDKPTPSLQAEWTTNISDGERVAQTITFIAEYPGELAGDLWVFVISPNGRAYPQSEDACNGTSIGRDNGRWEARIGLGRADSAAGELFDVVLAVANTPDDSQFIAYMLMNWCRAENFPGFAEMPEEVTEVHRVRGLVRTEEQWGRPPRLTTAQLDGQITISSPAEGDRVGATTEITGTYTATKHEIWVLVFPWHGRWYPQSEFPCEATHVSKGNGQWRAPKVSFGDKPGNAIDGDESGKPFDVVVILADEEASRFFDSRLKLWCKADYYPGLRTIELPPGIQEKSRIRVFQE